MFIYSGGLKMDLNLGFMQQFLEYPLQWASRNETMAVWMLTKLCCGCWVNMDVSNA